jgi:hypothetical protein
MSYILTQESGGCNMRYTKTVLLGVALLMLCSSVMAAQKWVRKESFYIVEKIIVAKPIKLELEPQENIIQNQTTSEVLSEVVESTDNIPQEQIEINETPIEINTMPIVPKTIEIGETLEQIIAKRAHPKMTKQERWYFTEEVRFLNKNVPCENGVYKPGTKIIIPKYSPLNGNYKCCSDMRNIMVAVMKGHESNFPDGKGVHWAYMIGVRTQENPVRDHYAYGVVCKKGTDLWTQAEWGAKILKRVTPNAHNPSLSDMRRGSLKYVGYHCPYWVPTVYKVFKLAQGIE